MFRQSPQNDSFLAGSESRRHEPDFSISPFPNYSLSKKPFGNALRVIGESLGEPWERQAAASEHPRQPDSSNQPFQRNSGESAWREAWGPPGLSWLLLGARGCSWTAPSLSWQARGGSDPPRLDHATVSCETCAGQSCVGPGVPGAVLAAPGEPGCSWNAPGLPEAAQKGSSDDPG